ncbi:MAG TPA: SAM-dependent methyltransferase [Nocardia sp.]|uniref:class I SAM-dependent methyltransferase n=1 Tax=Nocardia sp. TaxID=1821 RepID=UPI002B4B40FC|nr:SAM-dependent methyltransferase [Nocardia sp.]HLS76836.1 SAM-dependent methyltransferase [Nocardia sp.]
MSTPSIRNVSDTARWVAVYRAEESARPDALFTDPYAAVLAGEAGETMTNILPPGVRNHWPTVVRTKLLDELVLEALAHGCDRVINLGAGLDTRPFRLDLPAELSWHEADLAPMVAYKTERLAEHTPRCRWHTHTLDVTDTAACTGFLDEATEGARSALVLTEGLLPYLPAERVRALAEALKHPGVRWWAIDHWSPLILHFVNRTMGAQLGSARWQFAARLTFFDGWELERTRSTFRAAARWKRAPAPFLPWRWVPERGLLGRADDSLAWCGAVRLGNRHWNPWA